MAHGDELETVGHALPKYAAALTTSSVRIPLWFLFDVNTG
jgi:hypothetical protein